MRGRRGDRPGAGDDHDKTIIKKYIKIYLIFSYNLYGKDNFIYKSHQKNILTLIKLTCVLYTIIRVAL